MKPMQTIEKAQGVIIKEIDRISLKIAGLKEKYPEDMYGSRWMDKASDLEEERAELRSYLARMTTAERKEAETAELKRQLGSARNCIMEYKAMLEKLDKREADRLATRWKNTVNRL